MTLDPQTVTVLTQTLKNLKEEQRRVKQKIEAIELLLNVHTGYKPGTLSTHILTALGSGVNTPLALFQYVSRVKQTIRGSVQTALNALVKTGQVARTGLGQYSLPAPLDVGGLQ